MANESYSATYNAKDEEFAQETFDMIRDNDGKTSLQGMRQFGVGGSNKRENSDQENTDDDVEQENAIQRNITNETENIDIILESGAANGGFHVGCLLYIKSLDALFKGISKEDDLRKETLVDQLQNFFFWSSLLD